MDSVRVGSLKVHLWRLLPQRSLRRQARKVLREGGRLSRFAMLGGELARASRRSWLPVVSMAVLLQVPFVVGLLGDQPPHWLDIAWQVSATLVGLGVAVVVFLLQAAGSQSLSSDTTYRALLANTWLIWPAAMALSFLIAVAGVERFGNESVPTSAWANDWALLAFAVQVVGFGVAFARTVGAASPAGVRRVLGASFRASMRDAVHDSLLRKVMEVDLHELCGEEISHGAFLSRGKPLTAAKAGLVYDVDRGLPKALAQLKLGERVRVTVEPGHYVDRETPLAKLEGARGPWLERLVRGAVAVREVDRPASPVEVFEDVLDVARRALAVGSPGNLKSALQLVVDCLAELPASYTGWGSRYTAEVVGEPFAVAAEDEVVRSLASFTEEVFRSGETEAIQDMPKVAAGLLDAGLRDDGPLLVRQAASLWRRQLQTTSQIGNADLERRVREQIGRLCAQTVNVHQHRLEDPDRGLDARLEACGGLELLFDHQIEVLRHFMDVEDEESFKATWRDWVKWARHWNPGNEVEDLELRSGLGGGSASRVLSRELDEARALLEAKEALDSKRAELMHALGSWAFERKREGKLDPATWKEFVPYLVGAASDSDAAVALLRAVWANPPRRRLESWQLQAWDSDREGQPPDTWHAARLWATVLLIRAMPREGEVAIDLGVQAPHLGAAILEDIRTVEGDSAEWEAVLGDPVAAPCGVAREAVERAIATQAEIAARRLAEAPLDAAKVETFAREQRRAYEKGDHLRRLLLEAGSVEVVEDEQALAVEGSSVLMPKAPFVDLGESSDVAVYGMDFGEQLARGQMADACAALEGFSPSWEGDVALTGAVEAIEELRGRGIDPDVVLIPRDRELRGTIAEEGRPSEWEWVHDFMREIPHVATLSGVPVYEAGASGVDALIVCELGASLRKLVRQPPGSPTVQVKVSAIDARRAAELFAAGQRILGVENEEGSQTAAMRDGYVEVSVEIDASWEQRDRPPPAWRVKL